MTIFFQSNGFHLPTLIYFCLVWGFSPLSVMSLSEKISSKREGSHPPGLGTDPWPSPAHGPWQSLSPPTLLLRRPYNEWQFLKQEDETSQSPKMLGTLQLVMKTLCTFFHVPFPQSCPSSQRALALEVSGSIQINFLLTIHKQNEMCLK